uniref:Uncharacterized protein n=1 Tax=Heterorhabditis bacteriophora TaxID=37862 RepID=A0A1I7X1I8_HETBA
MDNWRSDYWRPYGQWSSEGAIRNSTWRTPHNQSNSFLRNCYDHDRASYLHHPYSHVTDYRQQQTQTVPISNITPHTVFDLNVRILGTIAFWRLHIRKLEQKYIKDENGQPANRINGMISGK